MKFARKKRLSEKKEIKRFKIGLLFLLIILIPLVFASKVNFIDFFSTLINEQTIKKPIPSNDDSNNLIKYLSENNIDISKILTQEDKIIIKLKEGITVIFSNNNLEKQVTSLQRILERFKIEGRKISSIDLRFSKPVVK